MVITIFKWFRRRGNWKQSNFHLSIEPAESCLQIRILKDGSKIPLPFQLSPSEYQSISSVDLLQLIEELWYDELLIDLDDGYGIPYDVIYDLGEEERSLLGVPKETSKLHIELDQKSFVGSPHFKIEAKLHYKDYFHLHSLAVRQGPIVTLPNGEKLLIEREQYEFLQMLDQFPSSANQEELFFFIAKLKNKAKLSGVRLSEHLTRENYEFIEQLDLDIEYANDELRLVPTYYHPSLSEDVLSHLSRERKGYVKIGGTRVFVDKQVHQQAKLVNSVPPITATDIPRFIENAEAFLPEGLDISLDKFGERVKSLGIRVYRAQPFVHANKTDRGWFQFDVGFYVKDDEGNKIHKLSDEDVYNEWGEKLHSHYIQLNNGEWVKIPESTDDFLKTAKKLKNEASDIRTNDLKKLTYILEIFENFDQVEYNEPIHEVKQSLQDYNVFEPIPPASFKAILKPFQQDGFRWLKSLRFAGYGGLLADDMGLGKTVQVIAFLTFLKEKNLLQPSLIVVPKSLMENWYLEMKKFAPILTEKFYFHVGDSRLKNIDIIKEQEIVVTTYQTLVRDQLILGQIDWEVVICDEAQAIKNPTTSTSRVLKALKAKFRLALTGTPVENTLTELWSIIDFVQPGLFGSLKDFKENYLLPLQNGQESYEDIQHRLEAKMKMIYKRRTKAGELRNQLPEKHQHKIFCPMSKEQAQMYQSILLQVRDKMIAPIEAILKLKMLLSHPALLDKEYRKLDYEKIPKLYETMNILREVQRRNEKVLIFTEYREMQTILKEIISQEFGVNAPIINGATERRQQTVDIFNKSEGFQIMILSPKAAGTGLTITSANHVIHYTRWWNPAVENQATDRVYRIGQEKDVHVYYPIAISNEQWLERTVEQIVDTLLQEKQQLANNIIVPSKQLDIEKELIAMLKIS
jgi:superfamily II DNA or RNA helicase